MKITVDIGNTTIGFGFFAGSKLETLLKLETNIKLSSDTYFAKFKQLIGAHDVTIQQVDKIIISSVVPQLTRSIEEVLIKVYNVNPIILGPGVKTGLGLKVDNPSEVGTDLVSVSVGALAKHNPPLVIADLGTVTKLIYIDERANFAGVSFIPGLTMSRDALSRNTAQLLNVSLEKPKSPIGRNTKDSLNAGLIYGTYSALKGLTTLFEDEKNQKFNKVLTGGNAVFVKELLINDGFDYLDNLIHHGLLEISNKN